MNVCAYERRISMNNQNKLYLTAEDVSQMLGISKGKSYEIIRNYNQELKKQGFLIIQGKVPRAFFATKYYGMTK